MPIMGNTLTVLIECIQLPALNSFSAASAIAFDIYSPPACMPAYSLVIPSSPMNVNTNTNSLLANYPSAGVSIPKDRNGKKESTVTVK